MGRAAWPVSPPMESRSMSHAPLNSARRPQPVDLWITLVSSPQPHRPNINSRSGHMMRYERRTSSRATDRTFCGTARPYPHRGNAATDA
jgi:hypothetical protein